MRSNEHTEERIEPEAPASWWKRWTRTVVFAAVIMLSLFVISLLIHRFQGTLFALGGLLDRNEGRLLVFRLFMYAAITIGAPLVVFRKVQDAKLRARFTTQFTIIFFVLFLVGELVVVQNIVTKVLF